LSPLQPKANKIKAVPAIQRVFRSFILSPSISLHSPRFRVQVYSSGIKSILRRKWSIPARSEFVFGSVRRSSTRSLSKTSTFAECSATIIWHWRLPMLHGNNSALFFKQRLKEPSKRWWKCVLAIPVRTVLRAESTFPKPAQYAPILVLTAD